MSEKKLIYPQNEKTFCGFFSRNHFLKHVFMFLMCITAGPGMKLFAQEGLDTALLKTLKVSQIEVFVKLPLLRTKTMEDSCRAELYRLDTLGRTVYMNNNQGCYGWSGSSEISTVYDKKGRVSHTREIKNGMTTIARYFYNAHNDPEKIIQTSPEYPDTMITFYQYWYNGKGKMIFCRTWNYSGPDTSVILTRYDYDNAGNLKLQWTYTRDSQLIQKQTFDITPISRKLLEFSTETKLPSESYTKGWNYYDTSARLYRTHYSNNCWTEFYYLENGLPDQVLNYNMQGKLNSIKRYLYKYHEKRD